jgi:DNA primase
VNEEKEIVIELLREVLGHEKAHYDLKCQITFDCPVCSYEVKGLDNGDGKGNLEINYCRHIYKCWSCSETHGTQGPLGKLLDRFGTKQIKKTYELLKPEDQQYVAKRLQVKLPVGYKKFSDSNPRYIPHAEAMRYLKLRGITEEIIEKFDMGYTTEGDFAFRIIIPSYDSEAELNYFVARTWLPNKMKYKNPTIPKETIIFNEFNIDFEKDIYLVEGAFDMFFLDNAIPLLGKNISPMLFEKIYNEAQGFVHICLDGDAWDNAQRLFHELNGGRLYGKIKIIRPPKDKDICDLRGEIDDYYVNLIR